MKAFVAVTDNDWFDFLSRRPDLDEVNFWQPSGKSVFKALTLGEPFLFKLKSPRNVIAGGGFFAYASILPFGLAWDTFEEKNGAASQEGMARLIAPLKKAHRVGYGDPIGCIMLRDPFFFEQADWFTPPPSFKPVIVAGKGFDLTTGEGRALWHQVETRLHAKRHRVSESLGPTLGGFGVARQRLGQGVFRARITDVYGRRCAVTGEKALPVLQAAHIKPVHRGGEHRIDNGLLLRTDVHTLFDEGFVTITPRFQFRVSDELRRRFHDGETYRAFQRNSVWVPDDPDSRPNAEFLEWHNDTVFVG